MANSLGRSVSAQENNVQDDMREEYECTICLNWLNEPVLTSCGHRFCKACITSWLRKDESRCPIDNKPLDSDKDIFLDNFTKRQIDQLLKPCPNANSGCTRVFAAPNAIENHLLVCEFNRNSLAVAAGGGKLHCTFRYCGCTWSGTGEEDGGLEAHLKEALNSHLEMLVIAFRDGQKLNGNGMDNPRMWDAPPKGTSSNGGALAGEVSLEQMDVLVRGLYERIVTLEQQQREQTVKVEKLTEELARVVRTESQRAHSDGVLVWKVEQFYSKVDSMSNNSNVLLYSHEVFTSPHGYKFCARLNISPKSPGFLGLHIHMMQSDNDYHLDWPFKGRIKIQLIHPRGLGESQSDTIMSKPEILAFHRPQERVSPRGFGFVEYAFIQDIVRRGFVDMTDTLTIKVQVTLV